MSFLAASSDFQSEVIHTDPYSFDHICWRLQTVKLYWQTLYFHFHFCRRVGRGFIWFEFWGFWFVVLCGNWEEVEL